MPSDAATTATLKANLNQLETVLNEYLVKKVPALPTNVKELIVRFAPYLVIIGVILAVPGILALFGLGAFFSVTSFGGVALATAGVGYYLGIMILIGIVVLEAMAIPGLKTKSKKGWNLIFYSVLLSAASSLISGNIVAFLLGTVIGLYFTFQVREYYK